MFVIELSMKKRMRKFWEATFESFETLFVRKWKKYLVKRQLDKRKNATSKIISLQCKIPS